MNIHKKNKNVSVYVFIFLWISYSKEKLKKFPFKRTSEEFIKIFIFTSTEFLLIFFPPSQRKKVKNKNENVFKFVRNYSKWKLLKKCSILVVTVYKKNKQLQLQENDDFSFKNEKS